MTVQTVQMMTTAHTQIMNVTEELAAMAVGITSGIALFYTPHTTAALILCEDDEELRDDIARAAETMFAPLRPFKHIRNNNPNAEAHLFSATAGTQIAVAVENGKLDLGTYQNILFVELDGPKQRQIRCKTLSDAR
jgi:secondary thiamine-phosphate synthase enzyme